MCPDRTAGQGEWEREAGFCEGWKAHADYLAASPSPPTDDEIERAAKAMYERKGEMRESYTWEQAHPLPKRNWLDTARAALTAARRTGGDDG